MAAVLRHIIKFMCIKEMILELNNESCHDTKCVYNNNYAKHVYTY